MDSDVGARRDTRDHSGAPASGEAARAAVAAAVAGMLAVAGCGGDDGVGVGCKVAEGEVRIAELMVDPPGDDGPEEWIELANAAGRDLVLDRLRVVVESSRRAEWELHLGSPLSAGGRVLVGGGAGAGTSSGGYVSWGKALELPNTGATVSLECGEAGVDHVSYGTAGGAGVPPVGHSLSRDEPGDRWCEGVTAFGDGRFGTPGESNPPCGLDSCFEAGLVRGVVALAEGEVVVSEVFAGAAGGGDWLEVRGVGTRVVDLNGVVVEVTNEATGQLAGRWVIAEATCRSVAPGAYVVIGAAGGGAAVDVPGLSLPGRAPLELRLVSGDRVVDRARVPAGPRDASVRLDETRLVPGGDAHREGYCEAGVGQAGLLGTRGTPGQPNGSCGTFSCVDGGVVRVTRAPEPGELVVTEVFARPALGAVPGGGRDWLELLVAGARPLDVNGLTLEVESADTGASVELMVAAESCAAARPGDYVVVAAATDPLLAGGVAALVGVPGLSLFNEAPLVITVRHGDTVIDVARAPPGVSGRSQSLEGAATDAASNDQAGRFCVSLVTGVFDEAGTPGRPNMCGPSCRDGEVRALRRPRAGDLTITEVFPDPTGADAGRDWLEVRAAAGVDLAGIVVAFESPAEPPGSGSRGSWTVRQPGGGDGCLPVAAGAHAVIGGVAASSLGATPVAVFGGSGDALLPSNPAVAGDISVRLLADGVVVAEATYPQLDGPDPARRLAAGKSWALDETSETAGASPARWCMARSAGEGFGDLAGTPGRANPDVCP